MTPQILQLEKVASLWWLEHNWQNDEGMYIYICMFQLCHYSRPPQVFKKKYCNHFETTFVFFISITKTNQMVLHWC